MKLVAFAAAFESATGLILIVWPSLLVLLLLGEDLSAPGQAIARVGGFGLLALGIACWPGPKSAGPTVARSAVCLRTTYRSRSF